MMTATLLILKRFLKDGSGHFALMTAITAPVAIILAAIAVDTGSLYVEKRQAQALADLAAITAAANLDKAAQAALATMDDNGVAAAMEDRRDPLPSSSHPHRINVVTGRYESDPKLDPEQRFIPGAAPANAASVTYRTVGTRYFAGALIPPPEIVATGIASTTTEAAFSVGSRLLALDGGIVNALLGGLTGSNISLSVMDYNALVAADVNLLSFIDALALDLNLTAGSYAEVLNTEITLARMGKALSRTDELSGPAKAAANKIAVQGNNAQARKFRLSELIDLGNGQIAQATIRQIGLGVSAMELLMLGAVVAGNGKHVALNLGADVPGLLSVAVDLAIGEPPQRSPLLQMRQRGEIVRTAQTRLAITAEIGNAGSLIGLLGARIRIPLYLEIARGEARLKDVSCPGGRPESLRVDIEGRPGVANLYLAEVDRSKIGNFANPAPLSPARLIQVPLVSVTGQANAEMSNVSYRPLSFTAADIASKKVKQVTTQDFVTSLTRSLFSNLSLNVNVQLGGLLNLPLISLPGNTTALLGQTIGAAAPALDGVLNSLLTTLGVSLGQIDVRVRHANCNRAVLIH